MIRPVVAQSYPLDRAALLLLQASERFSMGRGIIVGGTELSALNLFGLISQLGPDQCHRNQQRLHPLITRPFRACEAVRSLLSALAYNGKAVHEPREDVTGAGRASSCRDTPRSVLPSP
jgi:hypothetical protein